MMKNDILDKTWEEVRSEQTYNNGLYMLLNGAGMLILSIANLTENYLFFLAFILLGVAHNYAKKHYITPRVGYVQLNLKNTSKPQLLILSGLMLIFAALGITILLGGFNLGYNHRIYYAGVPFLITYVIFMYIMAKNKEKRRPEIDINNGLFVVICAGSLLLNMLEWITWSLLAVWGVTNIVFGIIKLRRFIKTYPVIDDET